MNTCAILQTTIIDNSAIVLYCIVFAARTEP